MAGVRSWEETLRRLAEEDPCSDTLLALERWLEQRPGYAVTFGKALQPDGTRIPACSITLPTGRSVQYSSSKGINVALTDAMHLVTTEEQLAASKRAATSEQAQPSSARSVGELLHSLLGRFAGGEGNPAS